MLSEGSKFQPCIKSVKNVCFQINLGSLGAPGDLDYTVRDAWSHSMFLCDTVVMFQLPNVLWTTKLHPTFHLHENDWIMT